jgi:ribosome biogenesis GTPase
LNLEDLGWDAFFAEAFEPYAADNLIPARVSARHHGPCELFTERGRMGGLPAGKLSDEELPAVGDWVAVRPVEGERKAIIEAVLPRRTSFSRKEANTRTVEQVVAANVDTWDSGSSPVVVVNKSDTATDPTAELLEVEPVTMGVPVHAVSAVTGEGLETLDPYIRPGRTIALLGSSGVGKSTLVNRLAGREVLATADTSAGGRGRHTTSHRELVPLPSGAVLLDTPGMRELQLWADEEVLDTTFSEISALAAECKFSDCAHEREPGCAIRRALSEGTLSQERWDSFRKLQREIRALEIRKDARLRSEARKERARFARSRRKTTY